MTPAKGQLLSNGRGSCWEVANVVATGSSFEVELVRREREHGLAHPFKLTANQFRLFCALERIDMAPA